MSIVRTSRTADIAWAGLFAGAVTYELFADDLLSMSADRWRARYPVATRLFVIALAGHFGGLLPPALDLFSAKNLVHRGACALWDVTGLAEPD